MSVMPGVSGTRTQHLNNARILPKPSTKAEHDSHARILSCHSHGDSFMSGDGALDASGSGARGFEREMGRTNDDERQLSSSLHADSLPESSLHTSRTRMAYTIRRRISGIISPSVEEKGFMIVGGRESNGAWRKMVMRKETVHTRDTR